jgi:hypothetical protein
MNMKPWHYFLSLERDFIKTIDYVEIAESNAKTHSIEFVKLLLLAGSEVDVVAKMICTAVAPSRPAENIAQYRDILTTAFPGIYGLELSIPRYELKPKPWASWDPAAAKSPDWWKAYNIVKHERDKNFESANQENVTNAMGGLMCLLLYFYRADLYLQPLPELFWCDGFAQGLTGQVTLKLPGT